MTETETKACKRCGVEKPLTEFYRTDAIRGYHRANCKECDRDTARRYYDEHPEHAERVRERARTHRPPKTDEEKRAAKAAYMREYIANNPEQRERAKERTREWHKAHPEQYAKRREYILQWHKDHPQSPEKKRNFSIRKLYGLTQDDYVRMLERQGGVCALCGTKDSGRKRKPSKWGVGVLAIDHCHKTGRVRGLLCHPCNARLGSYEHIIDNVGEQRIKEYLSHDDRTPEETLPEAVSVPGGAGAEWRSGSGGDCGSDDQG